MSDGWLGTKSFVASFAKSAMKEAKKTIDRAIEIKEEYEAQEYGTLAAMQEEDAGGEPDLDLHSGVAAWGLLSGSYSGLTGNQETGKNDGTVSDSEPVFLQPKSSAMFLPETSKLSVLSDVGTADSITPTSSSLMEASEELDHQFMDSAGGREDEKLVAVSSGSQLSIVTSHHVLATATSNPVSSESHTSVEVLNISNDEKKPEKVPSSDEYNSSMSSTATTLASSTALVAMSADVDDQNIGAREPAEGQESTFSCSGALTPETANDSDSLRHPSEATSSSKSYELIQSVESGAAVAKPNKPARPNSSGHTSGDDFEGTTATSSDIEVISNPLCESNVSYPSNLSSPSASSRASETNALRQGKNGSRKGHLRTGSGVSSEEIYSEIDKLSKKLSETNDILEARESKLVEMSRTNSELQERNTDLESQVREAKRINARLQESTLSTEEFTRRLSTMEQKLQLAVVERDKLKAEHGKLKMDASTRMSQVQVDELLDEKNEVIQELREEGEKLSKQVGKHSEIIRKLRSREKVLDKELKTAKEKLEEKTDEADRLSKNLINKNEVESKQIEVVTELTSAKFLLEEESRRLNGQLEDSKDEAAALRLSLEGAHKELVELRRDLKEKSTAEHELEIAKEQELRQVAEKKLRDANESYGIESDSLLRQIDELRIALSSESRSGALREDQMRRERDELLKRLEDSDARHEELSESVGASTRPLVRQIESLQASLTESQGNADHVERGLSERLHQLSIQLASSQERERNTAEQYRIVSAKVSGLESKMSHVKKSLAEAQLKVESMDAEKSALEKGKIKDANSFSSLKKSFAEEISELKHDKEILEKTLATERVDVEREKAKNAELVEQLKHCDKRLKDAENDRRRFSERSGRSPSSSPALSHVGMGDRSWLPDDVLEAVSMTRVTKVNSYDSARVVGGNTAALLESLQAQLKQKEGEVFQLQSEVSGLEKVKEGLSRELVKNTNEANLVIQLEEQIQTLTKDHGQVEKKYQTMLTMYGEKVEEIEELKLDLQDVKELYKVQIQELLHGDAGGGSNPQS